MSAASRGRAASPGPHIRHVTDSDNSGAARQGALTETSEKKNHGSSSESLLMVMSFIFSSLLGWIMIPLPLHARAHLADGDGTKTGRWLSMHVFLRLPMVFAVAAIGMHVEIPSISLAVFGFFIAAWAPEEDLAMLALCILTSSLCNLRSTLNLRMKLFSSISQDALSRASTAANRGRILGRVFRSTCVGVLYETYGFQIVCSSGCVLSLLFFFLAVLHQPKVINDENARDRKTEIQVSNSWRRVYSDTRWWLWWLVLFFSLHEFSINSLSVIYPVVAFRDVGLSEGRIGIVHSVGLLLALVAETCGSKLPRTWLLKSPLQIVALRVAYSLALSAMALASHYTSLFVLIFWLALGSEALLQKALMELIVSTSPLMHSATVLAIMEGSGAVLASFGIFVGSRVVALGNFQALGFLSAFATFHGILEIAIFYAIAQGLFKREVADPKCTPLKRWLWPLLQFQVREGLQKALQLQQEQKNS